MAEQQNPRVSIGLPVRNGDKYLNQSISALLAQSWTDFELIICDNASDDATESICRRFAASDPRIRYVRHQTNLGLTANFNGAFALSSGEYFKWATADDICQPRYVEACVRFLDENPDFVLAYPKTTFIDQAGNPLEINDPGWDMRSDDTAARFRFVIFAGHWNNACLGIVRRSAMLKTSLLANYPSADSRLLGELAMQGKVAELPESLYLRRIHPQSSSQNTEDAAWLAKYYRGNNKSLCLPFWNLSLDHWRTIWRSDLKLTAKLSLSGSLLHSMRWRQQHLWSEVRFAARALFGRIPSAPPTPVRTAASSGH